MNGADIALEHGSTGTAASLPTHAVARGPVDADRFRRAMRGFASTLTILAVAIDGQRHGMLANSVISISVAPPTLLVAVQKTASCHGAILRRRAFSVNVLDREGEAVAAAFLAAKGPKRFDTGNWAETTGLAAELCGLPMLCSAQAVMVCRVEETIASTTHTLVIGRVDHVECASGVDPLVYCRGTFGGWRAGLT